MRLLFIAVFLIISALVSAQIRIIDNPDTGSSNTERFHIHKLELKDSETILYCCIYGLPNEDIVMKSGSFLKGKSGKIYKVLKTEGIEPDKSILMPDSCIIPVVFHFEPLDKSETAFDLINEQEYGYCLLGIETNKEKTDTPIKCFISGIIIDRPHTKALFLYELGGSSRMNKKRIIPVRSGKFEYQLNCDEEQMYMLSFNDEEYEGGMRPVYFFAENGKVEMELFPMEKDKENKIRGGKLNKDYTDFNALRDSIFDPSELLKEWDKLENRGLTVKAASLKKLFEETKARDIEDSLYMQIMRLEIDGEYYTPEAQVLSRKMTERNNEYEEWTIDYIKNNVSMASYSELMRFLSYGDREKILNSASLYNTYKSKYPEHIYTRQFDKLLGKRANIKTKYTDFTAQDFNGNIVKFSELLKGKLTLLDLWESTCGPCRRFSMELIPIYEKYKDKGFNIIGVAREYNINHAIIAAKKDKYPWVNLVVEHDKEQVWEAYGLTGSGTTYLIDKDGNIIEKGLMIEGIKSLLEEQLKE
ncbi:AhpC/TSA family protein [Prevotella sp. 10(H)]|uniref:AhpC/TSA family protein n=1 Tax=Prevotella sp. 10(H) TaxID=1158294 RepID=UPI0004A73E7A|nr:AhpC/TSA family protein [Prevotella sp. 10(H)]